MTSLELKVPPLAVVLVVALSMVAAGFLAPSLPVPLLWRALAATVLATASAGIGLVTVGAFRHASTTVNPMTPGRASNLVTTGLYRYSRNPMYVGMLFGLLALAALLASPTALALTVVFVAYVTRFQIVPEERTLLARFGDEYEQYRRQVRRWV